MADRSYSRDRLTLHIPPRLAERLDAAAAAVAATRSEYVRELLRRELLRGGGGEVADAGRGGTS